MIEIPTDYKKRVVNQLLSMRSNFGGSNKAFATKFGFHQSLFSRLKNGEIDGLLKNEQWVNIGRMLGVSVGERNWRFARTEVFNRIEEDILFCRRNSKSMICVDDCGIGKTYSARYLSRTLKNCFYLDASQAKTAQLFIRTLAKTIGLDHTTRYSDIKANIKLFLQLLEKPMVIIDEAGDLKYEAWLELKELWNGTNAEEETCGWYLMGAEGFRRKLEKGMLKKGVGFEELFSRFSEGYTTTVPIHKEEKIQFYRKLITDVLTVNMEDKSKLDLVVKRCLTQDSKGRVGGLRRAESLLILLKEAENQN